jgi:Rrf2 family protein
MRTRTVDQKLEFGRAHNGQEHGHPPSLAVAGVAMPHLRRKHVLTIAAIVDIAVNACNRPVSAKHLADRHHVPPRYLEPVLHALVKEGILKSVRGPRGGYLLAREEHRITVDEILCAARTIDDGAETPISESPLLNQIIAPALAEAENAFSSALSRISVAELKASALHGRPAAGSRR